MRVDLLPPEIWEGLNDKTKALVKMPADASLRVLPGLQAALYETVMGTAQFFSHKKACGVVKGVTPYFEGVMPFLFKDGYQVQPLKVADLGTAAAWVEALKKDTNFVLVPEDHPVTGEIFDWDPLDQILNDKKIFSIRLSHFTHFRGTDSLRPYSVRICSISHQVSIVLGGNKFKSPPLIAHKMAWDTENTLKQIREEIAAFQENKDLVQKFESQLPAPFKALTTTANRVWDRSLIFSTESNGEAIEDHLLKQWKTVSAPPGKEHQIEATSLCRWGGISLFENWWEPKPAVEILRGLLVLSTQQVSRPQIVEELKTAAKECQISFEIDL